MTFMYLTPLSNDYQIDDRAAWQKLQGKDLEWENINNSEISIAPTVDKTISGIIPSAVLVMFTAWVRAN